MANRTDNFNRANTSSGLGTPSDAGSDWVAEASNFGIFGNQAYGAGNGAPTVETLECGSGDGTVQVTNVSGGSSDSGLYFRSDGTGANGFYARKIGGGYAVYRRQASSDTLLSGGVVGTSAANDVMSVVLSGTSINFKVNGTSLWSGTDSFQTTATKHGLYASGDASSLWDDWSFTGGAAATLAQGDPAVTSTTDTTVNLTAPIATGGTSPFTYQWQRATAANGAYANVGTNSVTIADSSGLSAGATYWYTITATDSAGTPQTATSNPVPAKLSGAELKIRFIGDSQWATPDYSSATNAAPQAFVDRLAAQLHPRKVTFGTNSNTGGTHSVDWVPGAAGTPLETAVTAMNGAGENVLVLYVGSNDSTMSGGTPVTPAQFKTNVASIVTYALANISASVKYVLLVKTAWYVLDPGAYDGSHVEALFEYNAKLDELANGTTVFAVGEQTRFQIPMNAAALVQSLNVHLLNPAGQQLSGNNAAMDFAGKLQFATVGGGSGGAFSRIFTGF